jgi:ferredoxin
MLSEEDSETTALDQAHQLPFVLEEIATVGIEVWLSTIAYGAKSVLLVAPDGLPPSVSEALDQQLITASEILKGLGYSSELIQRVSADQLSGHQIPEVPPMQPAAFSGMGGKRQLAYMAIDHLYDQAPRSRPMATLSVGAPFGTASVDEQKCTLCMSCVGACPGKALLHGQDQPRLSFIEANCIQCGTCTRTCPEDAIWITPRLLFDREARNKTKVLQEEEPFCCISCGKPFATQTMIKNMKQKLEGHWMFQDKRAMNRLMQCEDCRVIDVIQDQEAIEKATEGQILQ